MKTKIRKTMYIAAVALFVFGLGVNIYMTLNDPFENVSSLVLAVASGSGSSGGNDGTTGGTTDSGETGMPFWSPTDVKYNCGKLSWKKIEYYDEMGKLVGTTFIEGAVIKSEYNGTYVSKTVSKGKTKNDIILTGRDCPSGYNPFCSVYNPCKDA